MPSRAVGLLVAMHLLAAFGGGTAAAQESDRVGVVLAPDRELGAEVLAGAEAAGGPRWTLRAVPPRAPSMPPIPTAALTRLRGTLVEGEFSACLAAIQERQLEVGPLLLRGLRETAAEVLAIGASCAYQAGNEAVARELLARGVSAELSLPVELFVDPALERIAAALEAAAATAGPIELRLETTPSGAAVAVDGRSEPCGATPCVLRLRPGRHVLRAVRVGHRPRELEVTLEDDDRRTLALDPAPSRVIREQLGAALGAGLEPDDPAFVRAAASAFSTGLLVVGWGPDPAGLVLYDLDAGDDPLRERADDDGVEASARRLVRRWLDRQPRPVWAEPAFWIVSTLVVAAAVGATALVLALQPEPQFRIIGQ